MKRPVFLTIWLVLMTIGAVYSLYSYTLGANNLMRVLPRMNPGMIVLYTIISLVNLAAVILLWTWKKLGFYLVVAIAIIVASLNGFVIGILGVTATLFPLLGIGILYLAMKPVWDNFK